MRFHHSPTLLVRDGGGGARTEAEEEQRMRGTRRKAGPTGAALVSLLGPQFFSKDLAPAQPLFPLAWPSCSVAAWASSLATDRNRNRGPFIWVGLDYPVSVTLISQDTVCSWCKVSWCRETSLWVYILSQQDDIREVRLSFHEIAESFRWISTIRGFLPFMCYGWMYLQTRKSVFNPRFLNQQQ